MNDTMIQIHFNGEYWSENHLKCLGELISGIIKDDIYPDNNWSEKLTNLRYIYKSVSRENDEIAFNTGTNRGKLLTDRFIFIPTNF